MQSDSSNQKICGKTREEFLSAIEAFHGFKAPGLVIGAYMVDLAQQLLGPGIEADAVVESRHCLPDAVQIFTPCTIGNGWLKIVDWDKFALTLYDRHGLNGCRVWLDIEKLRGFSNLYNWYMRLVPKKSLPLEVLLEDILRAGNTILSHRPVTMKNLHIREKKKRTMICPSCGEAHGQDGSEQCAACRGDSYYIYS
ncbi:MAG: FmdE family protein [Thermodesulfobacteriota bacterium]